MERIKIGVAVSESHVKQFGARGIREPVLGTLDAYGLDVIPYLPGQRFDGKVTGAFGQGGNDLDSQAYDESPHPFNDKPDPLFTQHLLSFMLNVFKQGLPLRTVCLSTQALHVALGGRLHQHIPDIPSTVEHRAPSIVAGTVVTNENYPAIINGTKHAAYMQKNGVWQPSSPKRIFEKNSAHHQALADPVHENIVIVARAEPDGIIETVMDDKKDGRYIGDQGHPEVVRYSDDPRLDEYKSFAVAFFESFRDWLELEVLKKKTVIDLKV